MLCRLLDAPRPIYSPGKRMYDLVTMELLSPATVRAEYEWQENTQL